MLRWLTGETSTTTVDSSNNRHAASESEEDVAPSFPMPGSIQRVGNNGMKSARDDAQLQRDGEEEEDDDDEHRNAIANLDLHISPPSPERVSSTPVNHSATSIPKSSDNNNNQQIDDKDEEFKAPTFSLSVSSHEATKYSKPKPSHRPFPPEPVTLKASTTLNNGRLVTISNGSMKAGQQNLGSSLGLPPSTTVKPRKQRFVALEPGYSPLDWARLNREGDDDELRCGYDTPQKFTMSEVKEHATQTDAWSVFNGKVYNITPYLFYHPGGVKELMRVAGKDGTELFMQTHAWVNAEIMMEGCLIGFLVRE